MTVNQVLDNLRTQTNRDNGLGMFSGGFCTVNLVSSTDKAERYHQVTATYGVQNDVENEVSVDTYFMCKQTLDLFFIKTIRRSEE